MRTLAIASSLAVAVAAGAASLWERQQAREDAAAAAAVPQAGAAIGRASPTRYSAGACLAFAARGGGNGRTVFLDPGHGGRDPGAVGSVAGATVAEKRVTLPLARLVMELLRGRGYRVVLSRTSDSTVARMRRGDVDGRFLTPAAIRRDLVARNVCANAERADVLVGLHANSFEDPSVGGIETVYSANRSFSARSARLAAALQLSVYEAIDEAGLLTRDRGVRIDRGAGAEALTARAAAYGQLLQLGPAAPPWFRSPSAMPGAIVEALFLTNPVEAGFALSRRGRTALGRGVAAGIDAYFRSAAAPIR